MPLIQSDEIIKAASGYKFAITPIEDLGAAEYTLVGIACDVSGSVADYKKEMEQCLREILQSCSKSPRSENLMLRLIQFDTDVNETHGFKLLSLMKPHDYDNVLKIGGCTALYDSLYALTESVGDYGRILADQDFEVNGIVFVITDGCDNASKFTPSRIRDLRRRIIAEEKLESLLVILVGVGVDQAYLNKLKNEAQLDQFVEIQNASRRNLAKLAAFVSQSISSQSRSLGTGSASVTLTF